MSETPKSWARLDRVKTLEAKLADMTAELAIAKQRLAEEIKWGHRFCTPDNCVSSGTDCPARAEAINERG